MLFRKKMLFVLIIFNIVTLNAAEEFGSSISKEKRLIYTNVAMSVAILGWGYTQWNYTQQSFRFSDEGWFEKESDEGGADKLGHLFTNYTITHIAASLFESWGYSTEDAALYAALSSIFQSVIVMELGDGTGAGYGFSREDVIADIVGSLLGYIWYRYPSISSKIDFRVEYAPDLNKKISSDLTTDYESMKHLLVLKASGFELFRDSYAKYLELHMGYYGRGFYHGDSNINNRDQYIYAGVGINLSELLAPYMGSYSKFFNYYQMPYSYLQKSNNY